MTMQGKLTDIAISTTKKTYDKNYDNLLQYINLINLFLKREN
jgi:hypothetical protein